MMILTRRRIRRLEQELEQDELLQQLRAAWQQHVERVERLPSLTDEELEAIYRKCLAMPPVSPAMPPRTASRHEVLLGRRIAAALAAVVVVLTFIFGTAPRACAITPLGVHVDKIEMVEQLIANHNNV